MSSVRIQINERYIKKDGTAAIHIVVLLPGGSVKINTGISVEPERFDMKNGCIIGRSKHVNDCNLIIGVCHSKATKILVTYRLYNLKLTKELFIKEYYNPSQYLDFYKYMDEMLIDRLNHKEISKSSERHQRVALNKLKEYKSTLVFAEIDRRFIEDFRKWLRVEKGNSVNTIDKTLTVFKTYLNIAKRNQVITANPFDLIVRQRVKTERYFLTEVELKKLRNLYDSQQLSEALHRVLRYFLFMCLTGVRISDFMRLCKSNVQNNVLNFVPYKTRSKKRVEVHIPLVEKARLLISDENCELPKLFHGIGEQKFNKQLKEIMKIIGVKKPITSHSARHTFASLFLDKTDDVVTLQKILGHSNIEETMIYVHISNKKINEQMRAFDRLLELD